eukprot:1151411-Pelagomonas_calceolata.AAC.1
MGIWRDIGSTQLHNLAARSILAFNINHRIIQRSAMTAMADSPPGPHHFGSWLPPMLATTSS